MYKLFKVRGMVRIPPKYFGQPLEEVAIKILREQYEGLIHPEAGLIVAVLDAKISPEGIIIHGDGATYHEVEFTILTFQPILHEVVEGEVVDAKEFGIFINIGPFDALVHRSQIAEEPFKLEPSRGALMGQQTKRMLERGDIVRGRIINISLPSAARAPRIGMTLRQPFLGKIEWIKKEIENLRKASKK